MIQVELADIKLRFVVMRVLLEPRPRALQPLDGDALKLRHHIGADRALLERLLFVSRFTDRAFDLKEQR